MPHILCSMCNKRLKKSELFIKCSDCKKCIHQQCTKIPDSEFRQSQQNCSNWQCSICTLQILPFEIIDDSQLYLENFGISNNENLKIFPHKEFDDFVNNCTEIFLNITDSDDYQGDLTFPINSSYYDIHKFNQMKNESSTTLGLIHTNLASIQKNFDDLKLVLSLLKFDFHVIGISEHKIHKNGSNDISNISLPGYYEFEFDPTETSHGGTGFFIKESLVFNRRDDLKFNSPGDFESTFIEIILPKRRNIVIGCIYRHPTSALPISTFIDEYIEPLLEKISTENKLCSLMGDFNIDLLKIDSNNDSNSFFNIMTSYFFAPYILQPTRPISKTLIDNIFINSIEHNSYSGNLTIQISDHLLQFAIIEGFFKDLMPKKQNLYSRNLKNFNEREFIEILNNTDWDSIISIDENDPNMSMNNFYQHINYILDELAPYKKLNKREIKLKSKPWINNDILSEMKERDKLLHKYCKLKDKNSINALNIYTQYKIIRNNLTKSKRESKIKYYKEFFEANKKKSSTLWKGIKSLVNINNSSKKDIKLISDNGMSVSDPKMIAELFNNYFVNIGPSIDKNIKTANKNYKNYMSQVLVNDNFFLSPVTPQEIFDIIQSFDINKSLGPNSIPIFILKISNNFFSTKLTDIINLSFKSGIFPNLCKIAKVIPIFKKENPLLCENYRPISLLPIFSKIFEKVIYKRMYDFIEKNKLIYKCQFGFRSKHSTTHALISITESIKSLIDTGNIVGGVFIDLQKAFDTVNHDILCDKLAYYGFRGITQDLIRSFLSNRKQYVSINGFNSSEQTILCGVPQGSTLGPLLFLLYINDLHFSLKKSVVSHFADDTCITYSAKKMKSLETVLNCELKIISDWLNANRLSLNVNKSKLIIFKSKRKIINTDNFSIKLNGCKLVSTDNVKYLGLYLDKNLSFDYHINQLSKKLSKSNGILAKLRHFTSRQTLISVYYSIFYSHIIYGCPVWSLTNLNNINLISTLQKKCIRIINFSPINSHTNKLFFDNEILKLEHILKLQQMKLVFDFKHNKLPDDLSQLFKLNNNYFNTRNASNEGLYIHKILTTGFGIKSIKYSSSILWNTFLKTNNIINTFKNGYALSKYLKNYYISLYDKHDIN